MNFPTSASFRSVRLNPARFFGADDPGDPFRLATLSVRGTADLFDEPKLLEGITSLFYADVSTIEFVNARDPRGSAVVKGALLSDASGKQLVYIAAAVYNGDFRDKASRLCKKIIQAFDFDDLALESILHAGKYSTNLYDVQITKY